MGFEAPTTIYNLKFDGDQLDGLEVRVRALRFQEVLDNSDLLYESWLTDPDLTNEQKAAKRDELHALFMRQVVSWNVENDGQPVPATLDGLRSQEVPFVGALIGAWRFNTLGVSAPLEEPSNDGEPSLEASIPMESPSESLAS